VPPPQEVQERLPQGLLPVPEAPPRLESSAEAVLMARRLSPYNRCMSSCLRGKGMKSKTGRRMKFRKCAKSCKRR